MKETERKGAESITDIETTIFGVNSAVKSNGGVSGWNTTAWSLCARVG